MLTESKTKERILLTDTVFLLLGQVSLGLALLLQHRGADKSLARASSRCVLFDGENISFDASLVLYI